MYIRMTGTVTLDVWIRRNINVAATISEARHKYFDKAQHKCLDRLGINVSTTFDIDETARISS